MPFLFWQRVFVQRDSTGSTSSRQQVGQTQPENAAVTPVNDKKVEVVAAGVGRDDPFGGGFGDTASEPQSNIITGVNSADAQAAVGCSHG